MKSKNPRLGEATDVSALKVLGIVVSAGAVAIVAIVVFAVSHRHIGSLPDYRGCGNVATQNDATDRKQLSESGLNPTKPAHITHLLCVPASKYSEMASTVLIRNGYTVEIDKPSTASEDQTWLIYATRIEVPTVDYLHDSRVRFTNLATMCHGEYAGWSALD